MLRLESSNHSLVLRPALQYDGKHKISKSKDDDIDEAVYIRGFNAWVYKCMDI